MWSTRRNGYADFAQWSDGQVRVRVRLGVRVRVRLGLARRLVVE